MALTQTATTLPLITVPAVFESPPNALRLLFHLLGLAIVLLSCFASLHTTPSLPTPRYLASLFASYRSMSATLSQYYRTSPASSPPIAQCHPRTTLQNFSSILVISLKPTSSLTSSTTASNIITTECPYSPFQPRRVIHSRFRVSHFRGHISRCVEPMRLSVESSRISCMGV